MKQFGEFESIYSQPNVKLVSSLFSQQLWQFLLPGQIPDYDYDTFLGALARFPQFCGEVAESREVSLEDSCKRELATMLAHMIFESGSYREELDYDFGYFERYLFFAGLTSKQSCDIDEIEASGFTDICQDYRDTSFKNSNFNTFDDKLYFGRGSLHMRWNGNYGRFSKAYFNDDFNGKEQLLSEPQRVSEEPELAFTSLVWYYMTPQYPAPSAHDVVTGFFTPNAADAMLQIGNNFGTTIAIMAQDMPAEDTKECATGFAGESENAKTRGLIYNDLMSLFGLPRESDEDIGCSKRMISLSGAADDASHWTQGLEQNKCELVDFYTEFSIYNTEDYKRCVCLVWGVGGASCRQDKPPRCDWQNNGFESVSQQNIVVPKEGDQLKFSPKEAIKDLDLSSCQFLNEKTEEFQTIQPDFIALELIKDNTGQDQKSSLFRESNFNGNDSNLGQDAPQNMYIATAFEQDTILYAKADPINLVTDYSQFLHKGQWSFRLRHCIDRREEQFGELDCDSGLNFISLTISDCADEDSKDKEQCKDPEDPILPEEAEPIDPEPIDSELTDPEPEDQEPEPIDEEEFPQESEQPNSIPAFVNFDPFLIYELERESTLTIQLSETIDLDINDKVEIKIMPTQEQKEWIKFDSQRRRITAKPRPKEALGLHRLKIQLDDTKDQSEYVLSLWILKASQPFVPEEQKKPVIVPWPDPEPIPEPVPQESVPKPELKPQPDIIPEQEISNIQPEPETQSDFDPATLWAVETFKDRVQERQKQVLPEIEPEVVKEVQLPKAKITIINEIGEMTVEFSQKMLFEELFAGFEFESETNQTSQITEYDEDYRRLQSNDTKVNLSSLIKVEIVRGSEENSASFDQLGFETLLKDFDSTSIKLQLKFNSPLSVSRGDRPDLISILFVEPTLFVSQETARSLESGLILVKEIPKQFLDETSYTIAVIAGSTVQYAANTAFLSQFGVTICLAVSLKAMWNLMHVMQVMAYLRLLVDWPANSAMMLQSMHNAITLENIINDVYKDFQMTQFDEDESSLEKTEQEQLQDKNIISNNLALGLGIFGLFLGLLVLALLFYFMLKLLAVRIKCCNVVIRILKQKLFYNVWIRYMIESNLKMTHNCVFYLHISGSFQAGTDQFATILRIIILCIIVIWPFFTLIFLCCKREHLQEKSFRQKFIAMYLGNKTDDRLALTYTSVFCLRRMLLVCSFLALQNRQYALVLTFNGIQSLQFVYLTNVMPHEEAIHNKLEYFNELCLILMQYVMVFFIADTGITPELQWEIGNVAMCLLSFVFTVNFVVLVYLGVRRIIFFYRLRKARKAYVKARALKNARKAPRSNQVTIEALSESLPLNRLDTARIKSQIFEGIEDEQSAVLSPSKLIIMDEAQPNSANIPIWSNEKGQQQQLDKSISRKENLLIIEEKPEVEHHDEQNKLEEFQEIIGPRDFQDRSRNSRGPLSIKQSLGDQSTMNGSSAMRYERSEPRIMMSSPQSVFENSSWLKKENLSIAQDSNMNELKIEPEQNDPVDQKIEERTEMKPQPVYSDSSLEKSSSSLRQETQNHKDTINSAQKIDDSEILEEEKQTFEIQENEPEQVNLSAQELKETVHQTKIQILAPSVTSDSDKVMTPTPRLPQLVTSESNFEEQKRTPLNSLPAAMIKMSSQKFTIESNTRPVPFSPLYQQQDRQTFYSSRNSHKKNRMVNAGLSIVNSQLTTLSGLRHAQTSLGIKDPVNSTFDRKLNIFRRNNLAEGSLDRSSTNSKFNRESMGMVMSPSRETGNTIQSNRLELINEQAQRRQSNDSERGGFVSFSSKNRFNKSSMKQKGDKIL